jgi:hypothetical protein
MSAPHARRAETQAQRGKGIGARHSAAAWAASEAAPGAADDAGFKARRGDRWRDKRKDPT